MAITNYTQLKSTIADFLNRDDLTAVIPTFISLAESRINREVRHWRMENRATTTLNSQYESLPPRFIAPIRLTLTDSPTYELEVVSQAQMLDRRSQALDEAGRPQYYALTQGELEFFPTPDENYTLEMTYYEALNALSDSNANNWLLTNYPDVYLYGSLIHSAPYLSDDARAQTWAALYQSSIDALIRDDEQAKFGGTGLRIKIRSY
jgi:hypothetical protein